jgi:hypothetical protein
MRLNDRRRRLVGVQDVGVEDDAVRPADPAGNRVDRNCADIRPTRREHDQDRGWIKFGFDSKLEFLNPLAASREASSRQCEAEVLRLGKTVGFVEGQLMGNEGRMLARATSSVMLVPAERVS